VLSLDFHKEREREREMPRRRKCPTCWFTWLDKYNKPLCPKCQSPMPDGGRDSTTVSSRSIHTGRFLFFFEDPFIHTHTLYIYRMTVVE